MPSFFDTPKSESKFSKSNIKDYITPEYDKQIKVQFLLKEGERAKETFTHWIPQGIKKLPVRCLGVNCPICIHNQAIDYDKENKSFINRDRSFVANVMDLTLSKVCPKCETINEKSAMKCSNEECEEKLINVDPSPMNKVRYLEISYTLNERIKEYLLQALENLGVNADEVTDVNADMSRIPIIIKKYKAGQKTDYMVSPVLNDPTAVNPDEYMDKRFDLDKVGIHVDINEMLALVNGSSLKEVLDARKEKQESTKSELETFFGNNN